MKNIKIFKLTFPSTFHSNGAGYIQKTNVIKALRTLAPGMSLKEARDLTFTTGPQLLQFEIPPVTDTTNGWSFCRAMDTLAENGVIMHDADETEPADTPEPESLEDVLPYRGSISADIRVIVLSALRRKEYQTAATLIEVLKSLDI